MLLSVRVYKMRKIEFNISVSLTTPPKQCQAREVGVRVIETLASTRESRTLPYLASGELN